MAIKVFHLEPDDKPTPGQIREVERAMKRKPSFDEDNPELSEEQLKKFHRVNETKREEE